MAKSKLEKLQEEATKLLIPFDENTKEEDLAKLVGEKKAAEIEENKKIADAKKLAALQDKNKQVVLKNVFGDEMDADEYFFKTKDKEGKVVGGIPSYFNRICGMPVDDIDLITEFNRVFKPHLNFLFYKTKGKEVYLVIVPLKYAHTIGGSNESMPSDFQKHAISFIAEGSVNMESLKMKLARVASTIKMTE